jgi:hypothetical protein
LVSLFFSFGFSQLQLKKIIAAERKKREAFLNIFCGFSERKLMAAKVVNIGTSIT